MTWLFKIYSSLGSDADLDAEKLTSERSWRKFECGWLKLALGKKAFKDVKRVYKIGWTMPFLVEEFVQLIERGAYHELQKGIETLDAQLNEPVNDRPNLIAIDAHEFFLWFLDDGSISLKVMNGTVTKRKVFLEKQMQGIRIASIPGRKLVYPV